MKINVPDNLIQELPQLCKIYEVDYDDSDLGGSLFNLVLELERSLAGCYRQIAIDKTAITDLRQELTVASVKSLVG